MNDLAYQTPYIGPLRAERPAPHRAPHGFGADDMALIQRMILRRLAQRMALAFALVGVIGVTTQVMIHVVEIVDGGAGAVLMVRMFVLLLPTVAVVILPVALLVALVQTFDGLDEGMETAVLRAAGAGPWFLVAPALWLGAGVAVVVLAMSLWLEPVANRGLTRIVSALKIDALGAFATDGVFRQLESGLFVRGGTEDADGWLNGLFLLDRRDPGHESLTLARTARLGREGGVPVIEMMDGSTEQRDAAGQVVLHIAFGRLTLSALDLLADLPPGLRPRAADTASLLVSLGQERGPPPRAERAELARRATDWLYVPAFLALGLWLVLRPVAESRLRQAGMARLLTAVGIGLVLRLAGIALVSGAGDGGIVLLACVALPILAAAGFALLACRAATRVAQRTAQFAARFWVLRPGALRPGRGL